MAPDEWVFRQAGGCIIDTPDLPVRHGRGIPHRWMVTLWLDPHEPDGWGTVEWQRAERGWELPATLAVGDVIEFGIGWPDGPTVRWFGWLANTTTRALIIHGPYPHPADAHTAAQPVIDEVRLEQLAAPVAVDQ